MYTKEKFDELLAALKRALMFVPEDYACYADFQAAISAAEKE